MQVLVMGGTRFMGPELVEQAIEAGHEVTLFNRGTRRPPRMERVRQLVGDRDDPAALQQLTDGVFDAVVDLSAYGGRQTELLLDALPEVPRFVHCSTGAVYRPPPVLPWSEDTPVGPWELWGTYAVDKLRCEEVLAAKRPAHARTVVVRLPFVLGPRNYAPREEFVLNRVLDDEVILLPGDGCAVFQVISTRQVGHLFTALLDAPVPTGLTAYNAAAHEAVSLRGFVTLCEEVVGRSAIVRAVGGGPTGDGRAAFDAVDCVFPFPNANYILDTAALRAAGVELPPTSVREMLVVALDALQADPSRRRWRRTPAEQRLL